MTAYSDLQSQVSGLLNRRDATNTQIQGWIQLAIQRIQRELRVPAMEKVVLITIPANTTQFVQGIGGQTLTLPSGITVPSDMLELIDLLSPCGIRLEKKDVTEVLQAALVRGNPYIYYRLGGTWIIGEAPQPGDVYTAIYYAELTPLVNPADTNVIVQIAPDLIVYGALTFAGDFYVDKRTPTWEARYQSISQALQGMADADELSGADAVSLGTYWPDDGVAYGYP